jgi:2-oxoglutarate dehydrogenase E1 component
MMQQYRSNSYLFGGNAPYVEELYEAYLDNPGSVPDNWRAYFDNLQHVPAPMAAKRATWPMRRWSRALPSAPRPMPSP